MPNYAGLREKKNQLIRKARDGSVFVAPYSAASITALTETVVGPPASIELKALPPEYTDLGWTTTDGVNYGRETEISDINSFGSIEPTRSDVTRDTITMGVAAQEHKMLTLQLYTGADLTGREALAGTAEFTVEKPARPGFRYYRVLGLFVDDTDAGELYMARYMPRARVTEFGEQTWSDGDEAITMPLTFTGYEDSVLGYSHQWLFGGPGWDSLLADMDITQAP